MMIRKQLYLPEDLSRRLAVAARTQRKPEAQVIRELLLAGLKHRQPTQTAGDALLDLAQLGKELNVRLGPNASATIDDDLYGNE